MPKSSVLALVMAGGAGSRLDVLTDVRAKPAMPYAGVYRLIDFPLSNCMHSRIPDVWIIQQYQPHSLNEHVSNGRPWDLDRTHGGLRLLQPHQGGNESGWHRGNADAIFRHKSFVEEFGAELLVVLSADHVYKLDYRRAIETHRAHDADVTMVTTRVSSAEATRFGVVEVADEGRITGFDYKPDRPATDIAATEVFVFDARALLSLLEDLHEEGDDERLEDLGDAVLPLMTENGRAVEHRLEGYWRDLGLVETYWSSHMDLLGDEPRIALDDPGWPIYTLGGQRPPGRIAGPAVIDESLVSPGCVVKGRVERSVLAPGVFVHEGATVRDSVLLHGSVVEAGALVDCSVVDMHARIGSDARVGAPGTTVDAATDADIAVVGLGARIGRTEAVDKGARVAPRRDVRLER
jgi:glucose-1-phosphate adenylyltransferase